MEHVVLRERGDLETVLKTMREDILNAAKAPIIATVENALRGVVDIEVVVDRWPDMSALVIRNNRDIPRSRLQLEATWDWYMFCCKESTDMAELLAVDGVVNWEAPFIVYAMPESYSDALRTEARKRGYGHPIRLTTFFTFAYKCDPTDALPLPDELHFSAVKESEVEAVLSRVSSFKQTKKYFKFFGQGAPQLEAFRQQLHDLPHLCVRNAEDDIVAFVSMRFFGAVGLTWLREDYTYRVRGLIGILMNRFAGIVREQLGCVLFSQIGVQNSAPIEAMDKVAERLGGVQICFGYKVL